LPARRHQLRTSLGGLLGLLRRELLGRIGSRRGRRIGRRHLRRNFLTATTTPTTRTGLRVLHHGFEDLFGVGVARASHQFDARSQPRHHGVLDLRRLAPHGDTHLPEELDEALSRYVELPRYFADAHNLSHLLSIDSRTPL